MTGKCAARIALIAMAFCFHRGAVAQTNCEEGNGLLDFAQPKAIALPDLIAKFTAAESRAQEARNRYSYAQDVSVQTLSGKSVDGEFHEVTAWPMTSVAKGWKM